MTGAQLVRATVMKLMLMTVLVMVHTSTARAVDFHCIAQQWWCNEDNSCEGTGIAWSGCEVWCYINEGQQLSGYANCWVEP
jgi:hypothetical protein